jgi:AraC-like DNA-binding protein
MTYYHRLKLGQLDDLEILIATDYAQDFPLHYHETYCISLVEKGSFDENGIIATKGMICITHPNLVHENKLLHETGYSFITFYVSPDFLKSINGRKTVVFKETIIEDPFLFHALKHFALQLKAIPKQIPSQARLTDIFRQLVHTYHDPHGATDTGYEMPLAITEIKDHVEHNLHTTLSLDDLALLANMNRFQFIRFFKKNVGLSPFAYISLRRIEQTKNSLKAGNTIVSTAVEAGFYDQSHFHKYFRYYVGVTPLDYLRHCNMLQD